MAVRPVRDGADFATTKAARREQAQRDNQKARNTMRKRTLAAGLALAMILSLAPARAANTTYLDVDHAAWYSTPIAFCQQHLLMDGVSSGAFRPGEPLTKAILAEALYRLDAPLPDAAEEEENQDQREAEQEENDQEEELPFTDVAPDHPNAAAIRWAKEHGVINGYPDGTFHPDSPITREEIAVLLWKSRGQPTAVSEAPYTDREDIGDWAITAVDWIYEAKLMTGDTDGAFRPRSDTTRAEGATIVMNCAQTYYGMAYGYTLPEPDPMHENTYYDELYQLDGETGYLSYLNGIAVRGIDVSAHQKEIDWSRVAASGMRFAMIRAGYRGYYKGALTKDDYFDANMQGALANGMEVGVYFFSQALTPAEAEEEAYLVLDWIKDYDVTYPVVFDWEEQDHDDSRTQGCDGNTVTACALAFCKVIEDAGYLPMTYGSPSKVYRGGLALEYLQNYPFWLAHYTTNTAPTSFRYRYNIWQYSSKGRVDGINGNVDLDICLTPDWSAWDDPNAAGSLPSNSGPVRDDSKYSWILPFF